MFAAAYLYARKNLTYVNLTLQLPIEWPETIIEIVLTGFMNVKLPQMLIDANEVYKTHAILFYINYTRIVISNSLDSILLIVSKISSYGKRRKI